MRTLIIVTGISGSGKSTVANHLYTEIKDSTLIQVDTIKEFMYNLTGFIDKADKKRLNELAYNIFKMTLENSMIRMDKRIIVEYPFNKSWATYFKEIASEYNYKTIEVNVYCDSYEDIWSRIETRDNSKDRAPSHSIESYDIRIKDTYESSNILNREEQEKSYYAKKYTSLNIGKQVNYLNTPIKSLIEDIIG